MALRLEEVTERNVHAALRLRVRPEQRESVAPVAESLAEAYASRETAWPRLIYDSPDTGDSAGNSPDTENTADEPVGFVMANFAPEHEIEFFRCGIWRLLIDAGRQGRGYGRFAVAAVCEQARRRGASRVSVLWVPHEHGPEGFYRGLGFIPTGQVFEGEVVAELALDEGVNR